MTRDACQGEVSAGKLPEGAGVFSYRGDDEHGRMSYDGDWSNKARASNEHSRRLRECDAKVIKDRGLQDTLPTCQPTHQSSP